MSIDFFIAKCQTENIVDKEFAMMKTKKKRPLLM